MQLLFEYQELWTVVSEGIVGPADAVTTRKDLKARFYINQSLDPMIFEKIAHATSAKGAWDILMNTYRGVEKVKKVRLQTMRRQLELLQMTKTEKVADYFSRTLVLVNQMKSNGETISDVQIMEKILRTLNSKFEYKVTAIEESKDLETMMLDELMGSLQAHEQRLDEKSEIEVEEALQSQLSLKKNKDETQRSSKSRQWGQNSYNRKGGASSSSQGIGRGSNNNNNNNTNQRNKSQVQCFNCKKFGHYRTECRSRKQDFQANVAEDGSETLLLACNMAEDGAKNNWFLDSGCSNHMCGEKEMFTQLDESFTSSVKFGNDTTVPVMGKGKISITLKDGSQNAISDVLFVPNLHKNLLSVGQLSEKGYDIRIHEGICTINSAHKGLIAKVKMSQNRLFPLLINSDSLPCFSSVICDENWLWHMRFGHVNFGSLKQLASRKMVSGLPSINSPDKVCETCVLGKKHRDPFPIEKAWRASKPLELVHSDLCSVEVPSNGNSRYFITFIDDFSRKAWVYFLQQKSDACDAFKRFKANVEKQCGRSIKTLRTDRGTEYIVCDGFLQKHGINHQMTARYTPQQNGVAERKNRTVMDMVRCMLHLKNLPKGFWGDAVACAFYLLNRCPTRSVLGKTPQEAWTRRKPSIGHLRVFGCICYAHVPDVLRKKLDDKAEKCIFLGYSQMTKGYKLYNPVSRKVIISRDVTFDEQGCWDWSNGKGSSSDVNVDLEEIGQEEPTPVTPPPGATLYPAEPSSRLQRQRVLPARLQDCVLSNDDYPTDEELVNFALFVDCDPITYEDAARDDCWMKAMDEEIGAIEKNNTWELTDLPRGKQPIGVKWVYKTKYKPNGEVERYKARLVAKGYK